MKRKTTTRIRAPRLPENVRRPRRPVTMLTAYDAPTARLLFEAGTDLILVGDSVATVFMGLSGTRRVSLNEMISRARAVRRGAPKAFVVGDLPYESVRRGPSKLLRDAARFMKEGKIDAVKLEWCRRAPLYLKALRGAGVPVMGHAGLTPQTAAQTGGFRPRGRTAREASRILDASRIFEREGAFALVLECVPHRVADRISRELFIPVIGIGSGPGCDGQVLVFQDLLGFDPLFRPRFAPRYADIHSLMTRAARRFLGDVRSRRFPAKRHGYEMKEGEWRMFLRETKRPG